jgi:hypothetical protein
VRFTGLNGSLLLKMSDVIYFLLFTRQHTIYG